MPASSLRRTGGSILAPAALAASLSQTSFAHVGCNATRSEPRPSPFLVVGRSPVAPSAAVDDRAVAVLMAAMEPQQLAALEGALQDLERRLTVMSNPLVEDLADEPPEAALRAWLTATLPALTASTALSRPVWALGSGGGSVVRVELDCDAGLRRAASDDPGAACLPLWGEGDALGARARFAAWAVARAIVLRAPTPDDAARGSRQLRDTADGASRIALILRDDDALRGDQPAETRVRVAARAVAPRLPLGFEQAAAIHALARDRPLGRLFPDLGLSARDVLVVPKLSSLAERAVFAREVDARRGALQPIGRWVVVTPGSPEDRGSGP